MLNRVILLLCSFVRLFLIINIKQDCIDMRTIAKPLYGLTTSLLRRKTFMHINNYQFSEPNPAYLKLQGLFNKNKEYMQTSQSIVHNFSDQHLLQLIRQNYCFKDMLTVVNHFFIHRQHLAISNVKIVFMAYVFNLYSPELFGQPVFYQIIENNLREKIKNKDFSFNSYEEQKLFLVNIRNSLQKHNNQNRRAVSNLKKTFYQYILLKFQVKNAEGFQKISQEALPRLLSLLPFIPQEEQTYFSLVQLQNYYLNVLKYEIQYILSHAVKPSKKFQRQCINKFVLLCEVGIIISKNRNKFLRVLNVLPIKFEAEQAFTFYLEIIRQFFTYQLIKRLSYEQLQKYNYELSLNNRHYRSTKAYAAFENYVEVLILQKVNHVNAFDPYFNQNFKEGDYVRSYRQKQEEEVQGTQKRKPMKAYFKN